MCVDPRETVRIWLASAYGVRFEFNAEITVCEPPVVVAGRRRWRASRVWICPGDDLQTLFPEALAEAGLVPCKLQMMRSSPMPSWRIGPMLAAGLTLLHYRAFESCPTRAALEARLHCQLPEYRQYGIHVMVSQNGTGELVVGDSHEYGDGIEPFDTARIETLIVRYLRRFFDGPFEIAERWHGIYVKHAARAWTTLSPAAGVTIVTGLGGHGMTMSFGAAEEIVGGLVD
jgi:FAD dependent oxidoreductase TIGR03364